MKKLLSLALVLVTVLSLAGCALPHVYEMEDKKFSEKGLEITLTSGFAVKEQEGYTVCFDSIEVAVFTLKEEKSAFSGLGKITLADYATFVQTANADKKPGEIATEDGVTYMEYTVNNEDDGNVYKYFTTVHEADDAFWLVQFCAKESVYAESRPYFFTWAKSVAFPKG